MKRGSDALIVSEALANNDPEFNRVAHIINLLLEILGSCELVSEGLERFAPATIRRVNWLLLPPGDYPWHRLKAHIAEAVENTSDDTQRVIWNRQETLQAHGPDEIFVGQGGFRDYLAYVFKKRRVVVLESVRMDNAIYVLDENWQALSQLSKAEILNDNRHLARIIHAKGWKPKLANLLAELKVA